MAYPDSARDANGHGTHTSSTAAGGPVANANPLGIDRGASMASRQAPTSRSTRSAAAGLLQSDSVAAVARRSRTASRPSTSRSRAAATLADAVELAFLDAYAAGVLVSASAGNDGPGAEDRRTQRSVGHDGRRDHPDAHLPFDGHASAAGGATAAGVRRLDHRRDQQPAAGRRRPQAPYTNVGCANPAPAGLFTGKIVACQRGPQPGPARLQRLPGRRGRHDRCTTPGRARYHRQPLAADGAHRPGRGQQLLAFLAATRARRGASPGRRDDASGRPGDGVLVARPGHGLAQAGHHRARPAHPGRQHADPGRPGHGGPPGNLFQAIAGTSMSSPHIAGSAALVAALHPALVAGPDQVGAGDYGDDRGGDQAGRRHAGGSVRRRQRPRRPDQGR